MKTSAEQGKLITPADVRAQAQSEGPPSLVVAAGVATITFRRPSQRNSLHDEDLDMLLAHFAQVDKDNAVRVLVLKAETAGQPRPIFCAGYHVGGFNGTTHDPRLFERVPDALEQLRPITLCALGGSVYGGATDIVLACDLSLGLVGTEFRMPAVALGLHYYPSGLRRYVARLGTNMAKRAFLTAKPIPCEQLACVGLFEQMVAAEEFEATCDQLARHLSNLAPLAAQSIKKSINEVVAGLADVGTLRAREHQTLQSLDFAEGRAAFAARRAPRFTGQ